MIVVILGNEAFWLLVSSFSGHFFGEFGCAVAVSCPSELAVVILAVVMESGQFPPSRKIWRKWLQLVSKEVVDVMAIFSGSPIPRGRLPHPPSRGRSCQLPVVRDQSTVLQNRKIHI